ncbi:hypothetical protein ACLKA6_003502 [Drosophila palustris]
MQSGRASRSWGQTGNFKHQLHGADPRPEQNRAVNPIGSHRNMRKCAQETRPQPLSVPVPPLPIPTELNRDETSMRMTTEVESQAGRATIRIAQ